jgi:rod shape-determining protein MreC
METSRDDVGIAIRSAFLVKGTKQKFSLLVLIILSIAFLFAERIDTKPLNYLRSFIKDTIYRSSALVNFPLKTISNVTVDIKKHLTLYDNYSQLVIENKELKNSVLKSEFLELENVQLKKVVEGEKNSSFNVISARVMLDKQSPYLNSFILNIGSNKNIKNGMAVLEGNNFIGRIVDVNFFSSRVLLISDLNSRVPVITQPEGYHAILSGHAENESALKYLPDNNNIKDGDKVYTSGKAGIFSPGIPIGEIKVKGNIVKVLPFSELNQITFVNIQLQKEGSTN